MKAEMRKKLREILASADENFLVAIANKGLVRRAYKDLEECTLSAEETDIEVIVKTSDWTVWMPPEGPTKARDNTKATGITRQILTATIYLRDHWLNNEDGKGMELVDQHSIEQSDETPSQRTTKKSSVPAKPKEDKLQLGTIKDALVNLGPEILIKWAGKRLLEEAIEHSESMVDLEIDESVGLILKSSVLEIEVRVLPTKKKGLGLLEEVLSTAPKSLHKRWVLSAILALKQMEGKAIEATSLVLQNTIESPRTSTQILNDTSKTLSSMLFTGISHPSQRIVERLATLSMSASAVHLPRLAHLLRSLAEEVSFMIDRSVNSDSQRLFSSMCLINAIVKGLKSAAPSVPLDLAGSARSQYKKIGTLALTGVGAYPWQTDSGYTGLTVLLWSGDKQCFFSWSASRPVHSARGFNESRVYRFEAPWSGSKSPEIISKASFTLNNAFVNSQGRLSSSAETSAVIDDSNQPLGEVDFGVRRFFNWSTLTKYAASQFPTGLKVLHPLDRVVVVQPKTWGERFYDEMQQALCWKLEDDTGMPLLMTLPWNENNENAILFFEALKPEKEGIEKVVARINFSGAGFSIEPISLISDMKNGNYVLNPSFDHELIERKQQSDLLIKLKRKFKRDFIKTQMTGDSEWDEILHLSPISQNIPIAIRNTLTETEALLLRIAEAGINGSKVQDDYNLKKLSETLSKCGLGELARALNEVSTSKSLSENVLWSGYLCNLHWQVLTQQSLQSP